tara:strand:+ start:7961 stop:8941 length:981 start_codon:yes stop_codon:yes gene_type:complete
MSQLAPVLNQTVQGKAYEYACVQSIVELVSGIRNVRIIHNSSLVVARQAWELLGEELQGTMKKSSRAGIESLIQLEPKIIEDGNDDLELSLQEDRRGQEGDVRDVLIIRRSIEWEIGVSVKHNHSAVKHSRLSPTIDFGKEWLGLPCSRDYFDEIKPIFNRLQELKSINLRWSDIADKEQTVYIPLLSAFMSELVRLTNDNPGIVPARLLEYLLGRKDFYKIISNDSSRFTTLQCFNLHGTLNTASSSQQPSLRVRGVEMPSKIYHLDYKDVRGAPSLTTVQLVMDNNWAVTFRIHNASTMVEASLKFDIQLTGVPSSMFSNSVSW